MNNRELYAKMAETSRKTAQSLPPWIVKGYGASAEPKKEPSKDRDRDKTQ